MTPTISDPRTNRYLGTEHGWRKSKEQSGARSNPASTDTREMQEPLGHHDPTGGWWRSEREEGHEHSWVRTHTGSQGKQGTRWNPEETKGLKVKTK
jgi:hypothetical protein